MGVGVGVGGGASAREAPHFPQNFSPGVQAAPHEPHVNSSFVPHSTQNLRPLRFSRPQDGQSIVARPRSPRGRARQYCAQLAALSTWLG